MREPKPETPESAEAAAHHIANQTHSSEEWEGGTTHTCPLYEEALKVIRRREDACQIDIDLLQHQIAEQEDEAEELRAQVESLTREKEHAERIGTACLMLAEGADPRWTVAENAWGRPAFVAVQTLRAERDALRAELARQKEYARDYISRTDPLLSCGYHEADKGTPGEPCGTCRMCALEERHALRAALLALHPEDCGTSMCKARVVLGQGAPPAEAQCVYLPQSGLVSQMLEPDWPCRRCGQEFKEHVAFTALGHESEPPAEAPEK